jgi:hypothetical protein
MHVVYAQVIQLQGNMLIYYSHSMYFTTRVYGQVIQLHGNMLIYYRHSI